MLQVYLASRYSRREELCAYKTDLITLGYQVPARWLLGGHQLDTEGRPIGEHGEALVESETENVQLRAKFADDDWQDVCAADIVISFTEQPRKQNSSRGGRHVEFGIALALKKRVIIVGYRENVFYWLPPVEFFKTWAEVKAIL